MINDRQCSMSVFPLRVVRVGLCSVLLVIIVFVLPGLGLAQEQTEIEELKGLLRETQDSLQKLIEEHQDQMKALQERITELERRSIEASEKQKVVEERIVEQEVASSEGREGLFGRVSLHGYYDFQYMVADDATADSFVLNELSIFLRHASEDEKWTLFSELEFDVFDSDEFFFEDRDRRSEFEIETAWLEYRFIDAIRVRAGKLLLPQYWQTFHYPNLTLSTLPPSMVGSIFPKDVIGVEVRGDVWFEEGRGISYAAYVGNGGDSEISEVDRNNNNAIGGRLTLHLSRDGLFDTFDLSASGYSGRDHGGGSEDVLGFDTQIRIRKFEIQSEVAFGDQFVLVPVVNGPDTRIHSDTSGYYAQLAYHLAPRWHLFYRYDELDLLDGGAGRLDFRQHTFGVNFRPRANISLKLEAFRALLDGDDDEFNGLATSIVYNF